MDKYHSSKLLGIALAFNDWPERRLVVVNMTYTHRGQFTAAVGVEVLQAVLPKQEHGGG